MGRDDRALDAGRPLAGGSALDGWVPWLLLFGAAAFGIGWIVGVVGLWISDTWNVRDKVLGTLVWPGGLFGAYVVLGLQVPGAVTTCGAGGCVTHGYVMPPWLAVPVVILVVALPIVVAVHLLQTRRRKAAGTGGSAM